MIVNKEEPFTLLQFHSTDKQFSENILLAREYSHGKNNCVNLSLVLLGIIDKSDIDRYLDICTQRGRTTSIDELTEILTWSFNEATIFGKFPGVSESMVSYRIDGDIEVFKQTMNNFVGVGGLLKDNYMTPLLIRWNDGAGHVVILRKGGIRLGASIVDAQVKENQEFPFILDIFDDEDLTQKEFFIKGISTISILKGPEITSYNTPYIKIKPSKETMNNRQEGGKRKTRSKKRKHRRTRRSG